MKTITIYGRNAIVGLTLIHCAYAGANGQTVQQLKQLTGPQVLQIMSAMGSATWVRCLRTLHRPNPSKGTPQGMVDRARQAYQHQKRQCRKQVHRADEAFQQLGLDSVSWADLRQAHAAMEKAYSAYRERQRRQRQAQVSRDLQSGTRKPLTMIPLTIMR